MSMNSETSETPPAAAYSNGQQQQQHPQTVDMFGNVVPTANGAQLPAHQVGGDVNTLSPPQKPHIRYSPDVAFELQARDRSNSWPRKPVEVIDISHDYMHHVLDPQPQMNGESPSTSFHHSPPNVMRRATDNPLCLVTTTEGSPYHSRESLLNDPLGQLPQTGRRNPWGNQSYSDLITQAIMSAPDQRLTLAQIYDWFIKNIPYFGERAETTSAAGWKNSVRHNLSLHTRFVRVQNEEAEKYDSQDSVGRSGRPRGKSSWWTCNPQAGQQQSCGTPSSPQSSLAPAAAAAVQQQHSLNQNLKKGHRRRAFTYDTTQVANARDRVRAKLACRAPGVAEDVSRFLDPLQIDLTDNHLSNFRRAHSSLSDSKHSLPANNTPSPASPTDFEPNYTTLMPPSNPVIGGGSNTSLTGQHGIADLIQSANQLQLQTSPNPQQQQQISCSPAYYDAVQQASDYTPQGALPLQQTIKQEQTELMAPMSDILAQSTAAISGENTISYFPASQQQPYATNHTWQNGIKSEPLDDGDVSKLMSAFDEMPIQSPLEGTGNALTCDVEAVIKHELQHGTNIFDFNMDTTPATTAANSK